MADTLPYNVHIHLYTHCMLIQTALGECSPWVIAHDLHVLAVVLHANTNEPTREKRLEEVKTEAFLTSSLTTFFHSLSKFEIAGRVHTLGKLRSVLLKWRVYH
jgi:hypothetical protein